MKEKKQQIFSIVLLITQFIVISGNLLPSIKYKLNIQEIAVRLSIPEEEAEHLCMLDDLMKFYEVNRLYNKNEREINYLIVSDNQYFRETLHDLTIPFPKIREYFTDIIENREDLSFAPINPPPETIV